MIIGLIRQVRVDGAELEFNARANKFLGFDLAVSYLDDSYRELSPNLANDNVIRLTSQMPKTPEWAVNFSPQLTLPVSGGGILHFRIDYSYRDATFVDYENSPLLRQPAFSLVSARVAYEPADANWTLALNSKNLTDETYIEAGLASATYAVASFGDPRTFELSFRYSFGE